MTMKHMQTIFAKYSGRAFSTIASSPVSSSVMHHWKEQKSLGLCVAFFGGYFGYSTKNAYKRREHWHKVDRMAKEFDRRSTQLYDSQKRYAKGIFERLDAKAKARAKSTS